MTDSQVIVLATPLFLLLIAVEFAVGLARRRNTYVTADALNSIGLGIMSQVLNVFSKLLMVGIYALAFETLAPHPLPPDAAWVWVVGLLVYDFCYYWHHRFGHTVAVLWAAHAVHHQSEHFNLSTALRQESLYPIMGAPFFLPMAMLGVPTAHYALAGMVVLLYQFWIHTEHIGRLGWLDGVFSTPSNHRVHHAVNAPYLDRNYGAILVLWDRLFGSFAPEREPCVYGTVKPLASWRPLWAVGQFYAEMERRMRATPRWADKLRVIYKSPGWMPPGAALPQVDAEARLALPRFAPAIARWAQVAASGLFVALTAGTGVWLWFADDVSSGANLGAAAALTAGLWGVGALLSTTTPQRVSPQDTTSR